MELTTSKIKFLLIQLLIGILGVILGKLIAMYFSPEEYGHFNMQFAVYTFVFTLFISPFIQFIKSNVKTLLPIIGYKKIFQLSLIILLFSILLMYIVFNLRGGNENNYLVFIIIVLFLILSFLNSLFNDYLNIQNNIKILSISNLIKNFVTLILLVFTILFYKHFLDSKTIWIIQLGGLIIGTLYCVKFYNVNYIGKINISLKSIFKKYITYSWPLVVLAFWSFINNYFDRFILEYYFNVKSVGEYNAGYSVGSRFFLLLNPIFLTLLTPKIYSRNKIELKKKIIVKYSNYYLLLGIPIVLIVFIFRNFIGLLLLSSAYENGFSVIYISSISYFILTYTFLYEIIFYSESKTQIILKCNFYSAILNIIFNLILVPFYGLNGAAVSTLLAFIFRFILTKKFFTNL